METLDQIKHQIAKDNCFCDWKELLTCCTADMIEQHWNNAAVKYANQYKHQRIGIIGHIDHGMAQSIATTLSERGISIVTVDKPILEEGDSHRDIMRSIKPLDFEKQFLGNFARQDLDHRGSKYHK